MVTCLLDVGHDVRREEGGRAGSAHVSYKHVEKVATGQRIEAGKRFVEQEEGRSDAEAEGEGGLSLFAARQRSHDPLFVEAQSLEPRTNVRTVEIRSSDRCHKEVIRDRQRRIERRRLRDVAYVSQCLSGAPERISTAHQKMSRICALEPYAGANERRLAGSVWPNKGGDRAGPKHKGDVAGCPRSAAAITPAEPACCERRVALDLV